MESTFDLPVGELPQHPARSKPENIDSNWMPLKKALETFTKVVLYAENYWIHDADEDRLEEYWHASEYDAEDPPDRSKILLKSPLETGLSDDYIQEVARDFRNLLAVDPPEDWLALLKITNGIRGAGSYDMEDTSRTQREPFSPWEEVKFELQNSLENSLTGVIPEEIQFQFNVSGQDPDCTLICGFMCGMTTGSYKGECGVYYLLVEHPATGEHISERHWQIVGTPVRRDQPEQFDNIESVLRSWAEMYLSWVK
jgi:hypothetical protein